MTIENNLHRFKEIVKGRIKKEIKNYISNGIIVDKQDEKSIRISIPQIDMPRFVFDDNNQREKKQNPGESKDGKNNSNNHERTPNSAGNTHNEHSLEVDITLQELAEILGSELELPHIKHKNKKNIEAKETRYSSIAKSGPDSLHHFKKI